MNGLNRVLLQRTKDISGKTYIKKISQFSFLTGLISIGVALLVLIGWILDNEGLKSMFFHNNAMRPLAAMFLLASGLGLILSHHLIPKPYYWYLTQGAILFLGCVGVGSIVYYLANPEDSANGYGIIRLFHLETLPDYYVRMLRLPAPITAVWGCLFAWSLWLSTRTKTILNVFFFQTTTHLALMLCFISLLTYAFDYTVTPFFSVAFHSALVFALLFLGLLFARPTKYVTAIALSHRQGGVLLRRLFPIVLFIFFVIFSLVLVGQRSGLYDYPTAYVLSAVIGMIVLWYTILQVSVRLQIMDQKQERAEIHVRNNLKQETYLRQDLEIMNANLENLNEEMAIQEEGLRVMNQDLSTALKNLEERNFELDQFVYRTSHDLRSPLTSIMGLVSLMAEEEDTEQMHMYSSMIHNRILKLDEFIKTMLTYSRNSRVEIQTQLIDFEDIIQECMTDLQLIPQFEEIEKKWTISGEIPFWSDLFRLKIIFNNIISNSVKYARSDVNKQLSIHIDVAADYAALTFYDNGIGIQADAKAKVFDMFYRATTLSQGSGLGMYIVKQSVEYLHGQIYLDSELDAFTEIRIVLPNQYLVPPTLVKSLENR